MSQDQKDYYPFLNGSDIRDCSNGVECDVEKVRERKNGEGYFIDVKADDGKFYTISANQVLTHMLLRKLEGTHITVFPYEKVAKDGGENKVYLSLSQQTDKPAKKQSGNSKPSGYSKR